MSEGRFNVDSTRKERALAAKIRAFVEFVTPKGSRLAVEIDYPLVEVRILCTGRISDMGYRCGRLPDHEGHCHTYTKAVDFDPEP